MATQLNNSFVIDLSATVETSINAVLEVKNRETAIKEAEFQAAVAEGLMSYEAQLEYRQNQLAEEKKSAFVDEGFVANLNQSIATTKKMVRYDRIRKKYESSLKQYVEGKKSLKQHTAAIQNLLGREGVPDEMRSQLQGEVVSLNQTMIENEATAIKNRALVAQRDLSIPLIEKSIAEVGDRRAKDLLNGNEEAVSAWDETLYNLRSQKSFIIVTNGTNDIAYQTARNDLKVHQQVSLFDSLINEANANEPFLYNNVRYPSLKDYWTQQRDTIINSSEFWGSLSAELDAESTRLASQSPSGQITVARIKEVDDFYKNLATRPGFENYVDRIERERTSMTDSAVNELASFIESEATITEDYDTARRAALQLETTFGIKLTRVPEPTQKSFAETTIEEAKTVDAAELATPKRNFTEKESADLQKAQARVEAGIGSETDKRNVDFAKSQGWKPGQTTAPPTTAPISTATKRTFSEQETNDLNAAQIRVDAGTASDVDKKNLDYAKSQGYAAVPTQPVTTAPKTTTPAPAATPAPAPTTQKYVGSSVTDYLKSIGQDSSYAARQKLAAEKGIQGYTGTSQQNLDLLNKIRT